MPKDNETLEKKAALRSNAILGVPGPVLETHGGYGEIWKRCYSDRVGMVLEKDRPKVEALAIQRPEWAVYECDCIEALNAGLGADTAFAVLDVDPYGMSWPTLEAFFESDRDFADKMVVVVNDGIRQKLQAQGGYSIRSPTVHWAVETFGNSAMYSRYLEIAQACVLRLVGSAGYRVDAWAGYYANENVTHYAARLVKVT